MRLTVMKLADIRWSGVVILAMAIATTTSLAQFAPAPAAPPWIELRDITQRRLRAPEPGELGSSVPALTKDWLRLEARFETRDEWVDEVTVKFFVSLGEGRATRVFSGELTPVNLAGGTHYAAVFLHPNTLKRFGNDRVNAVAVQVFYKDKLVGQKSDPATSQRWWERVPTVTGWLLAPADSPWAPNASGRYEAIKAR